MKKGLVKNWITFKFKGCKGQKTAVEYLYSVLHYAFNSYVFFFLPKGLYHVTCKDFVNHTQRFQI